jgi:hypothetical protein
MLFVCTWLWGNKWSPVYAERLFAGIYRNIEQPIRSVLITDQIVNHEADIICPIDDHRELLDLPGCLIRIKMFDAKWQQEIGARPGDRIVNVDIDAVITGSLDPLFDRDEEFVIMQGFNQTNPCPFNGSLWMFRAGERHDVWTQFSLEGFKTFGVPIHSIPDDQGWLHSRFPDAGAWRTSDGVYAFKKIGWYGRRRMPRNARFVAFPGRDPAKYPECDWIKKHWIGDADYTELREGAAQTSC